MNRLTKSGSVISQKDINELMELSNENQFSVNEVYYKLKHYEDLEEQGKLLTLPCKLGTPVYYISTYYDCSRKENNDLSSINDKAPCDKSSFPVPNICFRNMCSHMRQIYYVESIGFMAEMKDKIGKKFFLTEQEAWDYINNGGLNQCFT